MAFAWMISAFAMAAPAKAWALPTCNVTVTVNENSSNNLYILSGAPNPGATGDLANCDPGFSGISPGVQQSTNGSSGLGAFYSPNHGGSHRFETTANDDRITYTPAVGFFGIETVGACGEPGTTNCGTITFIVNAIPPTVSSISPTSGPGAGGTTVVITGSAFTGATAVKFGATAAASFTVISSTQITATAPAGTGTVDVRVTTTGGTSATSAADQYTYVGSPTVSSVSPTAGPTTGGTTVVITGTKLSGATAVTFGATAATGFTVNSATQITATAPAGSAGTVDVRVTTVGGTSATSAADQYTYVGSPTVSSVSPTAGPTTGGTTVTVTGTGFSSTTAVTFGATAATGFTVNSATQITATAPAGTGTVDVRVTTAGGTSATSAADQFTYVSPPAVTSVSPTQGSTVGGTSVTINGTGFTGATAVSFGGTAATTFTVVSAIRITATAPAHAAGVVDISVTAPGGTSATVAGDHFTYIGAPTVTGISPSSGASAGGDTVTITGTNFVGITAITFGGANVLGSTVLNSTSISAVIPAHAAGQVNVVVTAIGGSNADTAGDDFTYAASLVIDTTDLSSPILGMPYTETVSASGGEAPYSFAVSSGSLPAGVTLSTSGQFSGVPTETGNFNFEVTATDSAGSPATATQAYTFSIGPNEFGEWSNPGTVEGQVGQALSTSITFGSIQPITYSATGTLPPGLTLAPNGTLSGTPTQAGDFLFIVSGTDSTTGGGPYGKSKQITATILPGAPAVTAVSPAAGSTTGGTFVTITGTNFTGATAVTFGATAATGFTVNSATSIIATAPAGTGTVDVRITAAGGTSATSAADQYTYVVAPVVTAVSPNQGPTTGGTTITITGSNFTGATGVTVGANPATSVTVVNAATITAVTPAGVSGGQVLVTTPGGTSAAGVNSVFYYVVAKPVVTSVSPAVGSPAGGQSIVITGTDFTGALNVYMAGTTVTSFHVDSATQITAVTPEYAAGGATFVSVQTAGGYSDLGAGSAYTYAAPPTITAMSEHLGGTAGGSSFVVSGVGVQAATAVSFGGTPAASFAPNGPDSLSVVPPAHAAGQVDVIVTTAGGVTTPNEASAYTYVGAPTVTAVSPVAGRTAGGESIVVTGANFALITDVTVDGASVDFTVDSPTQLTLSTHPHAAGAAAVIVTNLSGASQLTDADIFTYVAQPVLSSVAPSSGPATGGTTVVLTGSAFTGATAVAFGSDPATSFTVDSATQITAVAPAGAAGGMFVTVTTAGGTSQNSGSTQYVRLAAPTVTSISPTAGSTAGGTSVVVTGTNFTSATAVTFGATPATSFTVNAAFQITATAPAGTGTVDVRVTTGGGTSATSAADQYTYVSAPTVTSISPTAGPTTGGTTLTITGTGFSGATAVTFGATAATGFTVNSATSITATAPAGTGTVDVRITTIGGTSATSAADQYTYVGSPTVTSISPTAGPTTGGTTVTITGTNLSGATAVTFGATAATGFTVNSATSITATAPAGTGTVDVRVTTVGGTSATSAADQYTYVGSPTVTSISPTAGPTTGGTTVTITGTGFSSATAVTFGATAATGFTVNSATQITAAAPAGTGTVDVRITTIGGTSATSAADQYTYVSAPSVSSISPTFGPTTGGTSVTLSGANFTGATAVTFGATAATGFTVNSATQITATAPAGSAGTVDVRVTTTGGTSATSAADQYTYGVTPAAPVVVTPANGSSGNTNTPTYAGTADPNATITVYVDGASIGVTTASAGGDWTKTGSTPLADGSHSVRANATSALGLTSGDSTPSSFTVDTLPPAAPSLTAPTDGSTTLDRTPDITGAAEAGSTVTVIIDGSTVGTTTATGGAWSFTVPTDLAYGSHTVRATATDPVGNTGQSSATNSFTVLSPLELPAGPLAGATVGQAYSASVTATGATGVVSYEVTSGALPAGLGIDAGGALGGTPTAGGSFDFTVTASDAGTGQTDSQAYTITVAAPTIAIAPASLGNATVGAAMSVAITASGGTANYTYAVTAGALPSGVTLAEDGTLSGTPTTGGPFNFTVTATDSSGGTGPYTGSRAYTLTVNAANLVLTPAFLPKGDIAVPYSATVSTSGGTAPYSYAVTVGALPAGLSLDPATGVISGTPTEGGSDHFTITATDSSTGLGAPYSVSKDFGLSVQAATVVVTPASLPAGQAGVAYSQALSASGGVAPYSFAVTAGALPAGVSLSSDGVLSGSPTTGGAYDFTVTATDSSTGSGPYSGSVSYSLSIGLPAAPTVGAVSASVPYNSAGQAIALTPSGDYASLSTTQPAHGSVTIAGTTATYVPTDGYFGADGFTYTATGPGGTSAPAAVTITVGNPAAPTVAPVSAQVAFNSQGQAIALAPSGVFTSLQAVSLPTHGTVSIDGSTATYTPTTGYFGADGFTYTATGPGGVSAPATVGLTIAEPQAPTPSDEPPAAPTVTGSSATIDLGDYADGDITGFRITDPADHGQFTIGSPDARTSTTSAAAQQFTATYVPAANFMGVDAVTVVAFGPGGDSAPIVISFNVPGTAPDISASVLSNGSVDVHPTATLVGGPFQGVRITTAPAYGTASVSGLDVRFTPGGPNATPATIGYVIELPFGDSAPGTITIVVAAVPTAQDITATTPAGRPVTVSLTATAVGGPFTAAAVTGISPSTAGVATITEAGPAGAHTYSLTFTPADAFTGVADIGFTLSNASGASSPAKVTVTVVARPDPSLDPDVRGLVSAQASATARFADGQMDNFNRRLEQIRDGSNESSFGLNLSAGGDEIDPQDQRRQRLGIEAAPHDRDWMMAPPEPFSLPTLRAAPQGPPPSKLDERPSVFGAWTAGNIDFGRRDVQTGQRDNRFTTSALSGGVDMRVSDALVIGGGLGYGEDSTRIGDNGTRSEARTVVGAVYAGYHPNETVFLDGVLGYGDLSFDTRRYDQTAGAFTFGSRGGDMVFGSVTAGLEQESGDLRWSPYGRVDMLSATLDAFTESGAGIYDLAYQAMDVSSQSGTLGVRAWWATDLGGLRLQPRTRLEWVYEFQGDATQVLRYADWLGSPHYSFDPEVRSRSTVQLELGFGMDMGDGFRMEFDYRGAFGENGDTTHGLRFGLKGSF